MCVGGEKPNTETKCHLKKELILTTFGFYWDSLSSAYTLIEVKGEEAAFLE